MNAATWEKIWPELVKGVPAAFVALVIGCIAGYVAWRQYKVARAKLNLDLFEERYKLFDIVWEFLSNHQGPRRSEVAAALNNSIPKAYFIFGRDIGDFMRQLMAESSSLRYAVNRLEGSAHGSDAWEAARKNVLEHEEKFKIWADTLRDRFSFYMDFSNWR